MSNISFASTLRPILVAMAEPQFPEPTSATFSSGIVVGRRLFPRPMLSELTALNRFRFRFATCRTLANIVAPSRLPGWARRTCRAPPGVGGVRHDLWKRQSAVKCISVGQAETPTRVHPSSCVLRETIRWGRPRFAPRVSIYLLVSCLYLDIYLSILPDTIDSDLVCVLWSAVALRLYVPRAGLLGLTPTPTARAVCSWQP